jgi:hypothetical protein
MVEKVISIIVSILILPVKTIEANLRPTKGQMILAAPEH